MKHLFSRTAFGNRLSATYSDPENIQANLEDPNMPEDLLNWLSQLSLLQGVPFNYLVPDEGMLPPESIRFFYLDPNWVNALTDGANSIGRNLTSDTNTPELNLERAVRPAHRQQLLRSIPIVRARIFGLSAEPLDTSATISGFVLRSSLVLDYPDMGVNVYPEGHTPQDPDPEMLTILRLEQLGPTSDTLICLVSGDAYRVDIHEAPQALHYGIDCFEDDCKVGNEAVNAVKNLYTFGIKSTTEDGKTTNSVTMSTSVTPTDISSCFRQDSRVVQMSSLAELILEANKNATPPPDTTAPTSIDSAEMGFEMTEGVGMVSFIKSST
ncbi:MAG: hypothetical protein KDD15_00655 [Lewinella sp.]|nr:hypothetical protein [Lewinella sp.]